MNTSMVLNDALETIINETCDCLDCDRASVYIYDQESDSLWTKVSKGNNLTVKVPINQGIVG